MRHPLVSVVIASALFASSSMAETTSTTTTTVTLTPQQQTEVREYIVKEHRPSVSLSGFDVSRGVTLPPTVTLYSLPQADKYQYTVVNQKRVLVDPSSRQIVEVYESSAMPQSGSSSEERETTTTTEEHN